LKAPPQGGAFFLCRRLKVSPFEKVKPFLLRSVNACPATFGKNWCLVRWHFWPLPQPIRQIGEDFLCLSPNPSAKLERISLPLPQPIRQIGEDFLCLSPNPSAKLERVSLPLPQPPLQIGEGATWCISNELNFVG